MQDYLKNISIGRFLTIALSAMGLSVALMAAVSFYLMSSSHADTLEIDRVANSESNHILLANIQRLRARTKIGLYFDTKERRDAMSSTEFSSRLSEIEGHVANAKSELDQFAAIKDTDPEAKYVKDVVAAFLPAVNLLSNQVQAAKDNDFDKYLSLAREQQTLTKGVDDTIKTYIGFTTEYSDNLIDKFQENYTLFIELCAFLLVLSTVVFCIARASIKRHILLPLSQALEHLQHMSKADLSRVVVAHGDNEVGQLIKAMTEMQDKIRDIVQTVRSGSSIIFAGADEISIGNSDLSARTEQQAASLEETASSMEEMTATVKQNADNSRNASSLAREASNTVDRGKQVVLKVVDTMSAISGDSQKISHIIAVIDTIAFQTNILALNASVEAARAGEQGRGFAVVADEVRNLAGKSADAAREIKALIQESALRVDQGSKLVENAGSTMDEVVKSVSRVTDIIDEISSASQEQSEGIGQINEAVAQMDQVTQQNASLVQQAASASAALREEAHSLEAAVSVFNLGNEQSEVKKSPVRAHAAPARPKSTPATQPSTSKAGEWKEF
jgi:methyl-accepting chemotaxis protein-2 (aspartate sensor receptor)